MLGVAFVISTLAFRNPGSETILESVSKNSTLYKGSEGQKQAQRSREL